MSHIDSPSSKLTGLSMIDVARDLYPNHERARSNAKSYANAQLTERLENLARTNDVTTADRRRIALNVQRDVKARLGYGLTIFVERDGRIHFGSGPHARTDGLDESAIRERIYYRDPDTIAPGGLRLTDVFKPKARRS